MNQSSLHIEFEEITDLVVGSLSVNKTAEINKHLATCLDCSNLKTRVENMILAMRTDKLEDVPTHILERTFDLLHEQRAIRTTEKTPFLKKIIAVFIENNPNLTPAFGLRSGQAENMKRFWFQAEESEIDLRIEKTPENWKVSGQVFGKFENGKALLKSNENVYETELNEQCEFAFNNVHQGTYRLFFYFENTEVEIQAINIK